MLAFRPHSQEKGSCGFAAKAFGVRGLQPTSLCRCPRLFLFVINNKSEFRFVHITHHIRYIRGLLISLIGVGWCEFVVRHL
jgi:hypothetical protein